MNSLSLCCIVAGLMVSVPAVAETRFPAACKATLAGKRITVVVSNAPGGGYDTYARAFAPVIEAVTGNRASVANLTAAGGLVSLTKVAEATEEDLILLMDDGADVIRASIGPGATENWLDKLSVLGVFHSEPSVWLVRPGFDPFGPDAGPLVAAGTSADDAVEFSLMAAATGRKIETVSGYSGSKELQGAVLRGEADVISVSLATALNAVKGGDLAAYVVMADKAAADLPGVPFVAGAGGVVDLLASDLDPENRARALALAKTAADTGFVARTAFGPKAMRADLAACFTQAVDAALTSDAFRNAAEAEKRPVAPTLGQAAADITAMQIKSQIDARLALDGIAE